MLSYCVAAVGAVPCSCQDVEDGLLEPPIKTGEAAGNGCYSCPVIAHQSSEGGSSSSNIHQLHSAVAEDGSADAISEDGSDTTSSSSSELDRPAWQTLLLAVAKFLLGTVLCLGFADPLVGSMGDLSRVTGIPGFFIAFVAAPLASNASELVSSLKFALGKRSRNISVTFNQVRGY